jgi:uncharacterized membrane-anchored protein
MVYRFATVKGTSPMSRLLVTMLLLIGIAPAWAQDAPAPSAPVAPAPMTEAQRKAEQNAAFADAFKAGVYGPAEVTLLDQAKQKVPDAMIFVPEPQAARVMRAMGNQAGDNLVGLVMDKPSPWLVVIRFVKDGYVKDDDAKDWNADQLLKDLQDGTEEGNADRVARGFSAIEITGWRQPPSYDSATHRLSWGIVVREKGATSSDDEGVNYNTRALGREGYFSINLLTDAKRLEHDKPVALELLANLGFVSGKRYEDFNSATDHVAEYGLAALLGVVVAKKLGLIALAGVFFLKFAKIGAIALVAVAAAFRKLFRRNKAGV